MEEKAYFDVIVKKLSNESFLHIINIKEIGPELENLIDKNLPQIHSAGMYDELNLIKKTLREALNAEQKPYNVPNVKLGAIAEFFIHLYFTNSGYRQECLFQSLEEINGIKKGFDGFYSCDNEQWIMESKSSRTEIGHNGNLNKAYKDLSNKVSGKSKNKNNKIIAPWDNALKHAILAGSNKKLLDKIKKLSKDFMNGKYYNISDFNIIPSSTLFLNNAWESIDQDQIHKDTELFLKNKIFKKVNTVCITQMSVDLFLDYLNK